MRRSSKLRTGHPGRALTVTLVLSLAAVLAIGVFAVACGGGTTTSTTAAAPGTTAGGGVSTTAGGGATGGAQVVLKNFAFNPADVTIKAGESVTWTNQDSANHNVKADNGEFDSGDMANGATFSFTFDKAGTYPYTCTIHPNMKGTITVQ